MRLDTFHSVFIKLIWIFNRGQLDCDTAISLLCKRIKHPDVEDWKKLKRLLCFMNHTINNKIIIGGNYLQEMNTYIDSSHTVHMDMRVHTGGVSTFRIGVLTAKLSKQKMILISSN